jgi:extracellular matrix regulatory protein A
MIPVGHENYVTGREIVSIVRPDSAPAKKLRHSAEAERMLINATGGRKARSIIVTKSNHVILSALQTTTLKERVMEHIRKGLV